MENIPLIILKGSAAEYGQPVDNMYLHSGLPHTFKHKRPFQGLNHPYCKSCPTFDRNIRSQSENLYIHICV